MNINLTLKIVFIALFSALAGCNSSGSSATDGEGATVKNGLWIGPQDITIEFSSGGTVPDDARDIHINVLDGTVFIQLFTDGEAGGRSDTVKLNDGNFIAKIERNFSVNGSNPTKCQGILTYKGEIDNSKASGTIKGTLNCTDNKGPYQQFQTGTFTAIFSK